MTGRPAAAERDQILGLAHVALQAAVNQDRAGATAALKGISDGFGGAGLALAILAWCDAVILRYQQITGTPDGQPVRIAWQEADTGDISVTGRDVPAEVRWAGQLVAARAALDQPAYDALIAVLPGDGLAIGGYISALLDGAALTLTQLHRRQS